MLPCTPLAVVKILDYLNIYDKKLPTGSQLQGKTTVVVNRSEVVGRPLAAMLANDGARVYSVDLDSTFLFERGQLPSVLEGESLESHMCGADIVVLGVPSDKYKLNPAWVKEGATVVNVACHKNIDETELLSTRPGVTFIPQVSAVTVAVLQRNLVRLYNNFAASASAGMGANAALFNAATGKALAPTHGGRPPPPAPSATPSAPG